MHSQYWRAVSGRLVIPWLCGVSWDLRRRLGRPCRHARTLRREASARGRRCRCRRCAEAAGSSWAGRHRRSHWERSSWRSGGRVAAGGSAGGFNVSRVKVRGRGVVLCGVESRYEGGGVSSADGDETRRTGSDEQVSQTRRGTNGNAKACLGGSVAVPVAAE